MKKNHLITCACIDGGTYHNSLCKRREQSGHSNKTRLSGSPYQIYGELPKRKPAYEEQHFLGHKFSRNDTLTKPSVTAQGFRATPLKSQTIGIQKPY